MPKKPAETAMGVHDFANLLGGMARHNEGLPDRLRHILSPVTIGLLPPNACVSLPPESVAVVRDCLRDFQDCPDRQAETWAWAVVAHIRDRQISNIHTDLKFRHPDLAAMWRSPGDIVIASLPHDLQQRVLTQPFCGEDFVRAWIGEIPVLDIMGKVYDLAPKWQEWAKVNGLHPAHLHEASAGQGTAWVLPGAVVPVRRDAAATRNPKGAGRKPATPEELRRDKKIYEDRLAGKSYKGIADGLNEDNEDNKGKEVTVDDVKCWRERHRKRLSHRNK